MKGLFLFISVFILHGLCLGQSSVSKKAKRPPVQPIALEKQGVAIPEIALQATPLLVPDFNPFALSKSPARIMNRDSIIIDTHCFGLIQRPSRNPAPLPNLDVGIPFYKYPRRDLSFQLSAGGGTEASDGTHHLRDSRNTPLVFIDGVKTRGSMQVPLAAVEQVSILYGCIPANMGDTDSGVIQINTRSIYR